MNITVTDLATPRLQAVISKLGNPAKLNAVIATEAEKGTVSYISQIAPGKHKTAQGLGALPTGELERAAFRVTSTSSATEAVVQVPGYLFARTFKDVTIRPKTASFLTIPTAAASYGKRVGTMRHEGWKIFRPGQAQILLGYLSKGQKPVKLFALAKSAFQPQDRALLPSDEAYRNMARRAATLYASVLMEAPAT